jgi:glycosyltransferase involved in cell wall biosynthesis
MNHRLKKLKRAETNYLSDLKVFCVGDSHAIVKDISDVLELPTLIPRTKIFLIGIPRNQVISGPDVDGKYILFVGAVSKRKGVKTLLDAWGLLKESGVLPEYNLVICGPIGDDAESEEYIANNAHKLRIIRLKNVSEGKKAALLYSADAVVIPSNYESFGMVAVEAMQQGKRIIASNVGGLPEVLDGNAEMFNPGDFQQLAKIIEMVQPDLGSVEKQKMELRVQKFSVTAMVNSFERICQ